MAASGGRRPPQSAKKGQQPSSPPSPKVLLGFQDADMDDENLDLQGDFCVSKVGGRPDWVNLPAPDVACGLCRGQASLITQVYAPLEDSPYHRTLYVFACLRPACWNRPESWRCFRGQRLVCSPALSLSEDPSSRDPSSKGAAAKTTDWLDEADDWGSEGDRDNENDEDEDVDMEDTSTASQQGQQQHQVTEGLLLGRLSLGGENDRSDDASSSSTSSSTSSKGRHPVNACGSFFRNHKDGDGDDVNANPTPDRHSGATGRCRGPEATAEINDVDCGGVGHDGGDGEGDDGIVAVESPNFDLVANNSAIPELFARELGLTSGGSDPDRRFHAGGLASPCATLKPYYLWVDEETDLRLEDKFCSGQSNAFLDEHERRLWTEYKAREAGSGLDWAADGAAGVDSRAPFKRTEHEGYEKTVPMHGDLHMQKMISTIKKNPGQILRYLRCGGMPLFLSKPSPLDLPVRCKSCGGPLICEMQLLPSLIPTLKLATSSGGRKIRSGAGLEGTANVLQKMESIDDHGRSFPGQNLTSQVAHTTMSLQYQHSGNTYSDGEAPSTQAPTESNSKNTSDDFERNTKSNNGSGERVRRSLLARGASSACSADQGLLEFGTVMVFTCERSCWGLPKKGGEVGGASSNSSTYQEEHILLQAEIF